jgi:hypothetical protein
MDPARVSIYAVRRCFRPHRCAFARHRFEFARHRLEFAQQNVAFVRHAPPLRRRPYAILRHHFTSCRRDLHFTRVRRSASAPRHSFQRYDVRFPAPSSILPAGLLTLAERGSLRVIRASRSAARHRLRAARPFVPAGRLSLRWQRASLHRTKKQLIRRDLHASRHALTARDRLSLCEGRPDLRADLRMTCGSSASFCSARRSCSRLSGG